MPRDRRERECRKGRGASFSPVNRYATTRHEAMDDGWGVLDETPAPLLTQLHKDSSRSAISYNDSPDVGFDRSINPYRGCEHGCVYCFARPTHAWLGLSPGLDFESQLFYKDNAVELLRQELAHRAYRPAPVAVGINTDAYQPIERKQRLTRAIIGLLVETQHPFGIVTKSALIERDLDLLQVAAKRRQVSVVVSITTLDRQLARRMEPRAAAPQRRLQTIRRLSAAGIPVTVLIAPLIPVLTDHELETIMQQARDAGAVHAGYVLLRLPHELRDLFSHWLTTHAPDKAGHVLARLRDCHGGQLYDARFGQRMRGHGHYADLIAQRFRLQRQRLVYVPPAPLDSSAFVAPQTGPQMQLF